MSAFELFDKHIEYRILKTKIETLHQLIVINSDRFVDNESPAKDIEEFDKRIAALIDCYKELTTYIKR